jgi:transposase, IS5 family
MHRQVGQLSLADGLVAATGIGGNRRLERIERLLDWARLAQVVAPIYAAPTGRPSYPPLLMVKALLLQQWYGLSDPGLEEALGDRLSFRRFVGLALDQPVPDHSTISRFRKQVADRGLAEPLFATVGAQLAARGLVLKQGTLVDASLVAAQVRPPRPGAGPTSRADPDARWSRAATGKHFGYKAHLAVDQGSRLIRRAQLTPGNVNETEVADDLICGDEGAVYADKAYDTKARRSRLKAAGIKDRIMHRPHKSRALSAHQRWRNRLISPLRAAVEPVFGTLKRSYGYARVRYRSLRANATHFLLLCLAFNLRRAEVLTR